MAQRAAGFGKKPTAPRPGQPDHALSAHMADDLATTIRVVPLELAPLIAPYRKRGRVSLRIERMARRSRFTAGHNNGDGSWSLASDELEDLHYMLPEDVDEAHILAVRIIALDSGDASTVAVLEVPVTPLGRMNDAADEEFADVSPDLLVRHRRMPHAPVGALHTVEPLVSKGDAAPSLLVTPGHEERLLAETAAARQKAEDELRQARETCEALRSALTSSESELARLRISNETELATLRAANEQALEGLRRAAEEARTRASSKADEARDHNGEVGRLRDELAAMQIALSERESALKRAQATLAEREGALARAQTTVCDREDALAKAQALLKERDAALAQARTAIDDIRDRARRDSETALAASERAWKERGEARLAATEHQLREQSAKELAAAMAHVERTEAALKEARARAERTALASGQQASEEMRRLREECAAARAVVADREAELAQVRALTTQERESWRLELDAAISKAQTAWKADEGARMAAAEAQWLEKTKKALAAARAEAERDHGNERELQRLRAELAALHSKLVSREPEPIHRRPTIEPMYDRAPAGNRIVLRTDRGWDDDKPAEKKPRPWQHYLRDAAFVAVVAACAFLLYPLYGSGTFDQLRAKISMMVTSSEEPAPPPAPIMAKVTPPPAALPEAVAVHNANVRAEPSTTATVVMTLQHGSKAQIVKTQGNWTEVQIAGGKTPVQGWIYSTFLQTGAVTNSK
jgi:hypothetical protein